MVQSDLGELYLPLVGVRDVVAEKARLRKELDKAEAEIKKVEERLGNPAFAQKVPPNVLAEHQKRLIEWEGKKAQLIASLSALNDS